MVLSEMLYNNKSSRFTDWNALIAFSDVGALKRLVANRSTLVDEMNILEFGLSSSLKNFLKKYFNACTLQETNTMRD